MPEPSGVIVGKNVTGNSCRPEYVKVVHFAEQVLYFFQVIAPSVVLYGKKVIHDVAEALDADAKTVKRGLRTVAQGASMQLTSFGPALKREVLEQGAGGADAGGARRERLAPSTPLLAVEFFESRLCFTLLYVFAIFENLEKGFSRGPSGIGW